MVSVDVKPNVPCQFHGLDNGLLDEFDCTCTQRTGSAEKRCPTFVLHTEATTKRLGQSRQLGVLLRLITSLPWGVSGDEPPEALGHD